MQPAPRKRRVYQMLTRNMVLYVLAVAVVPLILVGAVTLTQFGGAYRQKVRDHLGELVQKHAQTIDGFFTDRLAMVRVLARSSDLEELSRVDFLRSRLNLWREEHGPSFVDLGLVDASGRQVAYAGPFNLLGADYSQAAWFQEARRTEYYISDVFRGLRGTPHLIVAVKKGSGPDAHIFKATIDFEAFNALVANLQVGQTGFAFILGRGGQFQTKPRLPVDAAAGPFSALLNQHTDPEAHQVVVMADPQGSQAIYAMSLLKQGQWLLCLKQQADDAYSDLDRTVRTAVVLILSTALVVVIISFSLSRRLVGRIARADAERDAIQEKVLEAGRLASLGELAAGVAHEINNPVAIMVEEAGWIQDLLGDEDAGKAENLDEYRKSARQITTQGERCKSITHKLLSFARKTDAGAQPVDLNDAVHEVIALLSQKSRYASVEIQASLDPGLPPISASPTEVQQVVLNLVNNAVDATEPEGGQVLVQTKRDGTWAILMISDDGTGIPEAILPRVFDPFFTTKPVGKGTGLGLSICYGIVNKLGGEISVDSQVGQGATFTLRLPLSLNHPGAGAAGRSPAPPSAGKETRA